MIQWLGKERGVDTVSTPCCLLDMFSQIHYQKSFVFHERRVGSLGCFRTRRAYQRHHQHCSLAQKLVAKRSKEFREGFFTSFLTQFLKFTWNMSRIFPSIFFKNLNFCAKNGKELCYLHEWKKETFCIIFKHCVLQRKLKVQFLPIFTTLSLQRGDDVAH